MDTDQKIQKLREKYPDEESLAIVAGWEKNLKLANLMVNLKNHDGMKLLIADLEAEVLKIKLRLNEDETLFKDQDGLYQGRLLHEKRRWIKSLLNTFSKAEAKVESFINQIDNKLLNDHENN